MRTLGDLVPAIELYHHTVRAGQYDEAWQLFYDRISTATYYQFGAYQLRIELLAGLFPDGDPSTNVGRTILPRLKDEIGQAWTRAALANSYSLSGQPARAALVYQTATDLAQKLGEKENHAFGLGAVAFASYVPLGTLIVAEANLRRSIALCREIGIKEQEGTMHYELGRVLAYCGRWDAVDEELNIGEDIKKRTKNVQAQGVIWAYPLKPRC